MSKKSKKFKRPEPKIAILSATEINDYIRLKFQMENDQFWDWFFGECPWGDTNVLSLDNKDQIIQPEFMNYFRIIEKEFMLDSDEDHCLEIENDL